MERKTTIDDFKNIQSILYLVINFQLKNFYYFSKRYS